MIEFLYQFLPGSKLKDQEKLAIRVLLDLNKELTEENLINFR